MGKKRSLKREQSHNKHHALDIVHPLDKNILINQLVLIVVIKSKATYSINDCDCNDDSRMVLMRVLSEVIQVHTEVHFV